MMVAMTHPDINNALIYGQFMDPNELESSKNM